MLAGASLRPGRIRVRFGIVGLGRIGGGLARQGVAKGHEVVAYNRTRSVTEAFAREGCIPAYAYAELAGKLPSPRVVLAYVPQGKPAEEVVAGLAEVLSPGDVVVDGGNSHWHDSARRHETLRGRGLRFLDAGTSGGVEGAREGACFMVGGDEEAFRVAEPVLRALAVPGGVLHAGPPGAGHFTKLVHNAVEFGMVQALAEGVALLRSGEYDLDLAEVMRVWSRGSVVRGWLVEVLARELRERSDLDSVSSWVEDTKEGKWYVQHALEREVPIATLALAELMFYRYRDPDSVAGKAVALLRHGYGGHPVHEKGREPR